MLGTPLATAFVRIQPDGSSFPGELTRTTSTAATGAGRTSGGVFAKHFSASAGRLLKVGLFTAGTAALGGFAAVLHTGIGEVSSYQRGLAQLQQGLKTTHNAAGVTAKGMENLASKIQGYSGQTDDSIVATEQLLLTFTNIRNEAGKNNDIFTQTTKIAADMAARLGGDASAAAIQLGKALNDPVKGITALTRVGVSFDDQQKKQIAGFVKAGDTMKAQKIILKELNKEFGGSARAIGNTLPGMIDKAKRHFEDWSQSIIEKVTPVVPKVVHVVKEIRGELTDGFNKVKPDLSAFTKGLYDRFRSVGGGVVGAIGKGFANGDWKSLGTAIANGIGTVLSGSLDLTARFGELLSNVDWGNVGVVVGKKSVAFLAGFVISFVANLTDILPVLASHWQETLVAVFSLIPVGRVAGVVEKGIARLPVLRMFAPFLRGLEKLGGVVERTLGRGLLRAVRAVFGAVERGVGKEAGATAGAFRRMFNNIVTHAFVWGDDLAKAGQRALRGLGNAILRGVESITRAVTRVIRAITRPFADAGKWLFNAGEAILQGLWDGMKSKYEGVKHWVGGIGGWIKGHKGPLDYDRKLLVPAGQAIMDGLAGGLKSRMHALQDWVAKIRDVLSQVRSDAASFAASIRDSVTAGLDLSTFTLRHATGPRTTLTSPGDASGFGATFATTPGRPGTRLGDVLHFADRGKYHAEHFAHLIRRLIRMKYSQSVIEQVTSLGISGGAIQLAEVLATASPRQVRRLNNDYTAVQAAARVTGRTAKEDYYGPQLKALSQQLDQLHQDLQHLKHVGKDVGEHLDKTAGHARRQANARTGR